MKILNHENVKFDWNEYLTNKLEEVHLLLNDKNDEIDIFM